MASAGMPARNAVTDSALTPVVTVDGIVTLSDVPLVVRTPTSAVMPSGPAAAIDRALIDVSAGKLMLTLNVVVWPAQMDVGVVTLMSCAWVAAGARNNITTPDK